MGASKRVCVLGLLLGAALALAGPAETARVWVFIGHPGDAEHEYVFGSCQEGIISVLNDVYGIPSEACRVLAGEACRREDLEAEINAIALASQSPAPIWLFFLGHANPTRTGANYNLTGVDVTAGELGTWLRRVDGPAPVALFFTMASSGVFMQPAARPGRVVVTATQPRGEVNETTFPHAMVEALKATDTDADGDGAVTALELFRKTTARVAGKFVEENLAQTEHALLDGDGDGKGTHGPGEKDAEGARRLALTIIRSMP